MMPRTHLPRDVIPAKADDHLALSPAPSGEREEAGPTCLAAPVIGLTTVAPTISSEVS